MPGAEALAAADLEASGLPPDTAAAVRRLARTADAWAHDGVSVVR
ncbi:hypothetical protein AB0M54_23090 [Actinoplanes sp. NPDC051470]